MKRNPLTSLGAKIGVIGVMALGAFTGAAYAGALPSQVQRDVSDVAGNLGLSVSNGESPSVAPLDATTTRTPATINTAPANSDNGAQNDKNDGTQNDRASNDGASNDGAHGNLDDGAKNDKDDGAQNDGPHANVDQGQLGNADQGAQGDGNQGNSDQGSGNQGDGNH